MFHRVRYEIMKTTSNGREHDPKGRNLSDQKGSLTLFYKYTIPNPKLLKTPPGHFCLGTVLYLEYANICNKISFIIFFSKKTNYVYYLFKFNTMPTSTTKGRTCLLLHCASEGGATYFY